MIRPLIVIRRVPQIDFMRWHILGFAFSILLGLVSIGLFVSVGLNFGIDFNGGMLIEAKTQGPADLATMRSKLDDLHLGEVSLQNFGAPDEVLIRLPQQAGGDKAQEAAIIAVKQGSGRGDRVPPHRRWSGPASAPS